MKQELKEFRQSSIQENNKVLVIKDKESLIGQIKAKLERNGFKVRTANSIEQALSYLESSKSEEEGMVVIFLEKSKTILVIEDEEPLLKAVKKGLELKGFSVLTARSAKQALSYLEEIKGIDIIWLDHYLLGEETGIDFVISLKSESETLAKIPIFVVSNYDDLEKRRAYSDLGVDQYYSKVDYPLWQIIEEIKNFQVKQ